MLISMDSGASALDQFQQELNVIGNNIANVDTAGFKSSTMNFEDTFNQTLGSNSSGFLQVGNGVQTSDIAEQFTQGAISSTGVTSNLAINGNGFFQVKDPTSGEEYLTRDGDFTVDSNGYLVTSGGLRVQGYNSSGLSSTGDIRISNANSPTGDTAAVENYSFGSDGTLTVELSDGTQYTGGQVLLQNCTSPQQLYNAGNNLYSNISAAGALSSAVAPGGSGTGSLVTGSLEGSNVDLSNQLTDLITAQRAYEANAKVVTTSDQILQDATNIGR